MNILKDINNNPLKIGQCYKNIGQYVKQTVNIKDDTYLGKLNEIIGEYGSSDPRFAGRNKIYIFENNNKLDEYFIKKQNTKFKEVSCDSGHTELPRYDSNEPLPRTLSLTQPPEYEEYEPPPSYVKKNTFGNTLGNTFTNTFTKLTRGKSPPYTETGGKNKKKRTSIRKRSIRKRSIRKRSIIKTKKRATRKHRKRATRKY